MKKLFLLLFLLLSFGCVKRPKIVYVNNYCKLPEITYLPLHRNKLCYTTKAVSKCLEDVYIYDQDGF